MENILETRIEFPKKAISVGEMWVRDRIKEVPSGQEIYTYQYTLKGIDEQGPDRIIRIQTQVTMKLLVKDTIHGKTEMTEGEFKGGSVLFFSEEKGRIVKSEQILKGRYNVYRHRSRLGPYQVVKKLVSRFTEEGYEALE